MQNTSGNKWLGSGWKMHRTLSEAQAYAESLRTFVEREHPSVHLFVVPPFTALSSVCRILSGTQVQVGGQNMHWADHGAFTGEISPLMIRDCGAQIVELGHSERREYFAETDYSVNKKVLAALQHGLHPLICVGETAVEKEFDVAETSVQRQVKIALHAVPLDSSRSVMIATSPCGRSARQGAPQNPITLTVSMVLSGTPLRLPMAHRSVAKYGLCTEVASTSVTLSGLSSSRRSTACS